MKEVGQPGWSPSPLNRTDEDVQKAKKREEEFNKIRKDASEANLVKRMGFDLFKGGSK